jgi:hypothetical protein
MKTMFSVLIVLSLGPAAWADLSLKCKSADGSMGIALEFADGWYLKDPAEPNLIRRRKIKPLRESNNAVEFLFDFGSDHEKRSYLFSGLRACGKYDSSVGVVTLTKSLKSFNGRTRLPEIQACSCVED